MSKKLTLAMALVGVVAMLFAAMSSTPAAAITTGQQKAGVTGFCGPAFSNKAQMIAWYRSHPARRAKAEKYVRAHAGYYHIQADQSFISWLTNPHLIIKRAPAGYTLISNTYCDAAGNVHPYNGKLNVGGVPLLWWCSDTSGTGHNCTPVAKYYCRNWVSGHKAFPKKHLQKATIYLRKGCVTGHQDRIDCPSGVFQFVINGKHVFYTPPPSSDKMVVGRCTIGKRVPAKEINIPDGWEIDPGTSPVQPAQKCKRGGILFTFKNMEVPPPPPPVNNPPPAPACYGSAAHLQTGGNAYLFCEVVLPTGATSISGESISVISGPSGAYVNGLVPTDVRWDGTPCPSNTKCYRMHMWAGSEAGDLVMKFHVTANFSSGTPLATVGSVDVTVPIKQEVPF